MLLTPSICRQRSPLRREPLVLSSARFVPWGFRGAPVPVSLAGDEIVFADEP
jgi:hypothetical protein